MFGPAPITYWIGTLAAVGILILLLALLNTSDPVKEKPKPLEFTESEQYSTDPVYDSKGGEWRRTMPALPDWKKES